MKPPTVHSLVSRAPLALALGLGVPALGATVLTARDAHAQVRSYSAAMPRGYDMPLGFRPVEPATEVGAEIANPFFHNGRVAFVTRPYFGFRLRTPWEIYFTIPVTFGVPGSDWIATLGNIEVMASHRIDFGPNFRMAIAFGGFVPSPSCFNYTNTDAACGLRYDGIWSTGGYMPSYYTPGHMIGHFRLGFAWNPGRGMFTLSWEIGNELRIRVADSAYYNRAADVSLFAGAFFDFRVHRIVSVGFGLRFYDWLTQGNASFVPGESAYWRGAWSAIGGVRFHAGVFEPGIGLIFMAPGPFVGSGGFEQGATIFADLRARWY